MKSYLQVKELKKSFGDRVLFENITFGIYEGDKVGLIAKNGAGKTTLLKIIAGEMDYDSGDVVFCNDLRVGYLRQLPEIDENLTVLEACLDISDDAVDAIKLYEDALETGDVDMMDKAMRLMDATDAWTYEDRIKQILTQLKIVKLNQPVKQLSGGQIKRVALAKVIINEPDLLILDEPTNHLDIEIIEWLEDYLKRSRIALLMVTHDRYFLDRVCSKIIEIDDNQIYTYDGNYNYYLTKREERINAQNAELAKVKNLLRTEIEWMRRQPQARGSKAKYRIDAYYELDKKSKVKRDDSTLELSNNAIYIGKKIFEAKNVCKRFGDKVILDNFNYIFSRYEKLGIIGDNGVGKTTFIKLLLGLEQPDSGSFDIGETVDFGHYSQNGIEFNDNEKVIDAITKIAEYIYFDEKTKYSASQFLQLFLFSPNTQQKLICKLSGGEKRRLYLATVLMKNPNFLILDEPTNDLDIVTLEVLEDYLRSFKGCLIVISHDRFFMDKIVDHVFAFEGNGKIKDFPGNYSDYREWSIEETKRKAEENKKEVEKPVQKEKKVNTNKKTFKEKKEFETLSAEIDQLENEKKELEEELNSAGTDYKKIEEISNRISDIIEALDMKEMRWLELSEKD